MCCSLVLLIIFQHCWIFYIFILCNFILIPIIIYFYTGVAITFWQWKMNTIYILLTSPPEKESFGGSKRTSVHLIQPPQHAFPGTTKRRIVFHRDRLDINVTFYYFPSWHYKSSNAPPSTLLFTWQYTHIVVWVFIPWELSLYAVSVEAARSCPR